MFTSSQLYRLMSSPRSKKENVSQGAKTYILETIAEMLTGESKSFSNYATEWGNDHEVEGLLKWSLETGIDIQLYGDDQKFITHETLNFGGTPDAMTYDPLDLDNFDKVVPCEIKCPTAQDAHLKHLLLKNGDDLYALSKGYYWQCVANAWITNSDKCYFISYNPNFIEEFQIAWLTVELKEADVIAMTEKIQLAYKELESTLNSLWSK